MDTTQNRLAAVQKKINQVLQRLSSKTQTIILIVLVIILLVLVALLFL